MGFHPRLSTNMFRPLDIQIGEDRTIKATEDTEEYEGHELSRMPVLVIRDLEQDKFASAERIKEPECHSSDGSTEERLPHNFRREEVRYLNTASAMHHGDPEKGNNTNLLQREKHTTNRSSKSDSNTRSRRSAQNFPALALVVIVFTPSSTDNVSNAGCNVYERAFLAQGETRPHRHGETK
jgi:hypothetical protein